MTQVMKNKIIVEEEITNGKQLERKEEENEHPVKNNHHSTPTQLPPKPYFRNYPPQTAVLSMSHIEKNTDTRTREPQISLSTSLEEMQLHVTEKTMECTKN